jgi:hypothetical protein
MVLEQETRLSFNTPTVFSNRFSVVVSPDRVRIAFGEAVPGETKAYIFSSAVLLGMEDAKLLAEFILSNIQKQKELGK